MDAENHIIVKETDLIAAQEVLPHDGIVIWEQDRHDAWAVAARLKEKSNHGNKLGEQNLSGQVRGDVAGMSVGVAVSTTQLDQLLGAEMLRSAKPGGILSPPDNGILANPQITIRRRPRRQTPHFLEDSVAIYRGKEEVLRIPLRSDVSTVPWNEIEKLPASLKRGLAPGLYMMELQSTKDQSHFEVLPLGIWKRATERASRVGSLIDNPSDPLVTQLKVEQLLGQRDRGGRPTPLTVDAFQVLLQANRTAYLEKLYNGINDELNGKVAITEVTNDLTGIPAIDAARDHITRGNWRLALDSIQGIDVEAPPRTRGLANLYEAVLLSESGVATGNAADAKFKAALDLLASESPADAYRAHYNYSNFLLRRAQDRLYNHAFLAATGSTNPLLGALHDWIATGQELEAAEQLSAQLDTKSASAVQVNIARQYLLLLDLLAVLNSGLDSSSRFIQGEQACREKVVSTLSRLLEQAKLKDDGVTSGYAHEVLAQLAYRQGDYDKCRSEANSARAEYLDQGNLAAVEGIERLLGLSEVNDSGTNRRPQGRSKALTHFLLSHELAEFHRQRFPQDAVGLSLAGFFARRAYVNEQIIELYLQDEKPELALTMVENAKARALSDVLSLNRSQSPTTIDTTESTRLSNVDPPAGTIVLEYFLGSDRGWLFVVKDGKVRAFPLIDSEGRPIKSRELIASIQSLLVGMEGAAEKMLRQIQSRRPLDSTWQNELNNFYQILIPLDVQKEVAEAKLLVIIPHHILHYFPFAALVTDLDASERKSFEMPMPRFLVEQGPTISYAPSLSSWQVLRSQERVAHVVHGIAIGEFANAQPLPGTREDITNLVAAFSDVPCEVFNDNRTTEDTIRDVLRKPGFTFIGTHGVNIADQPLNSYLLCAADDEDGMFTAAELYRSGTGADAVVLSACYSGLGDRSPIPGDDLFGLQRAFLHTGANVVVAGLWDVYDTTAVDIMNNFFGAVRAGKRIPEALAGAQRKFLAARRAEGPTDFWIHPYFWAVYKSTGSDLTMFDPSGASNSAN